MVEKNENEKKRTRIFGRNRSKNVAGSVNKSQDAGPEVAAEASVAKAAPESASTSATGRAVGSAHATTDP